MDIAPALSENTEFLILVVPLFLTDTVSFVLLPNPCQPFEVESAVSPTLLIFNVLPAVTVIPPLPSPLTLCLPPFIV